MTRWRSIAPVILGYEDVGGLLSAPFDFGQGVRLGPSPPLTAEDISGLSDFDKHEIANRQLAFTVDYEDGGKVDPQWKGRNERWRFQIAGYRVHYATLALWLTRRTPLSTRFLFHHSETPGGQLGHARVPDTWSPFFYSESDATAHLEAADLEVAKNRFRTLWKSGPTGVVGITVNLLLKTLSDREAVSRFAGIWTCIEALFGPDSPGETTHQLAERIALFLRGRSPAAFKLYCQIKKDYGVRSKVLHGMKITRVHERDFPEVFDRSEELVRIPLARILDSPDLLAQFNNAVTREQFLKRLPFTP